MATQRNPKVFGQDLVGAGVTAIGAVISAAFNDKFLWPTVKRMVPSGVAAQAAHAVGTAVSGAVIGKGASMLGQRKWSDEITLGGVVMGTAEALSIPIPGFSLTGSIPNRLPFTPPPAQLPAGSGTGSPVLSLPAGSATGHTFGGI